MVWERVLWKRQLFSDNRVGDAFFRLKKKSPVVDFSTAILGSLPVSQEICSCLFLVGIFTGLLEKKVSASHLTLCLATVICLCYFIKLLCSSELKDSKVIMCIYDVKVAIFTCVLLWFLSPIIQTLTGSVATDTIMACTTMLLVLHLLIHPYGAQVAIENPVMSSNLGIFASVCLASRLHNQEDVFTLMIAAVALFTLFPSFPMFCKKTFPVIIDVGVTILMLLITGYTLLSYSPSLVGLFITSMLMCCIFATGLFTYMQPYRQNIYGPWDEAQIKDR